MGGAGGRAAGVGAIRVGGFLQLVHRTRVDRADGEHQYDRDLYRGRVDDGGSV